MKKERQREGLAGGLNPKQRGAMWESFFIVLAINDDNHSVVVVVLSFAIVLR